MSIPDEARLMGEASLCVVPIGPGTKHPPFLKWQLWATSNAEVHQTWWIPHPEWGLGWKMGRQDDGRFLITIDVDLGKGGKETLAGMFEADPRLKDEFAATCRAVTGSGGAHFVFELPHDAPHPNNRARLRPGIDIRAEAGQIVVQPSIHPETGKMYRWVPGHEPWVIRPSVAGPATLALLKELTTPPPQLHVVPDRVEVLPSTHVGESPGDWVRRTQDFSTYLVKHGWEHVRQESWRRPDKADRGTSAELKGDGEGPLNIFTTDVPEALAALGKPDSTGQCISVTLFDFIAAYEYDGDRSACGSAVRRRMNAEAGVASSARAVAEMPPPIEAMPQYRLPVVGEEYWSASARNRHVLAAARAAMVSPDALDLVVFALQSLLIPSQYLLPAIVGGKQPLNMLACLIANTGLFKTSTLDAARDLMGPFPPWVTLIGMGSGEGIGTTFLREETEESAKTGKLTKTGRLVRNDIEAAFFEADEGSGLSEQARRSGATIIANLCKAWSGSTLGEANADPAKRRHVLDRDYRIAALVNIQPSAFVALFSEANTGVGLTGRFMFSGTLDYDIPDERGPDPGRLEHPTFAKQPVTLEIDAQIIAEAEAEIRRRHRTSGLDSQIDAVGQNAAVIARMAGIAVLVDGRRRITPDDWAVAQMRARTSADCLKTLSDWSTFSARDRGHKHDAARAQSAVTMELEAERIKTGQTTDRILTVLSTDGPMSPSSITAKLAPSMRPFRDVALATLVSMGKVRQVGKRYERV